MVIFALSVERAPETPGIVNLPHRIAFLPKGRGFKHHVYAVRTLHHLKQVLCVFQGSPNGRYRTCHMLAVLQDLGDVLEMTWSICCDEYCFNVVIFDEFFKGGVGV